MYFSRSIRFAIETTYSGLFFAGHTRVRHVAPGLPGVCRLTVFPKPNLRKLTSCVYTEPLFWYNIIQLIYNSISWMYFIDLPILSTKFLKYIYPWIYPCRGDQHEVGRPCRCRRRAVHPDRAGGCHSTRQPKWQKSTTRLHAVPMSSGTTSRGLTCQSAAPFSPGWPHRQQLLVLLLLLPTLLQWQQGCSCNGSVWQGAVDSHCVGNR